MSEDGLEAPEGSLELEEDFRYLLQLLPEGWQEKARSLGALRRCRGVSDAESLLRVLLIHLAEGCSLRETSLRVRRGNIAQLSDVAIMDRLRLSGEWFRWMNTQLMNSLVRRAPQSVYGQQHRVKLVDATRVQEPGPTGSSWVLHYCVALNSLACEQVIVTDQSKGSGESFKLFQAQAGDLYLADRAYGVRPGIFYLREAGAEVLVRFALDNLPLQDAAGICSSAFDGLAPRRLGIGLWSWPSTTSDLRAGCAPLKRVVRPAWLPKRSSSIVSAIGLKLKNPPGSLAVTSLSLPLWLPAR